MKILSSALILLILVMTYQSSVSSAEREKQTKEDREYTDKVKKQFKDSEEGQKYATEAEKKRAEDQKKTDLAEFKEKSKESLENTKDLFKKAESAWKDKKHATAGSFYKSVSLSTAIGSEEMSEASRGRLIEMEDMAKELIKAADDADIRRDFEKEISYLSEVVKSFGVTSLKTVAQRRLINLKINPDVAASVDYALAEELETEGKLALAIEKYNQIVNNLRYEHSVIVLKTNRKLEELARSEMVQKTIKDELTERANKEAPKMINNAKNYIANSMKHKAVEILTSVIEKFKETEYSKEAEKLIKEMGL